MFRRDLLKLFGVGSALPMVKSVERLEMNPDDTLVLNCDQHISAETADCIKAEMEKRFPGRKVLVLSKGLTVSVLRSK